VARNVDFLGNGWNGPDSRLGNVLRFTLRYRLTWQSHCCIGSRQSPLLLLSHGFRTSRPFPIFQVQSKFLIGLLTYLSMASLS
jgi:hypothetical protein